MAETKLQKLFVIIWNKIRLKSPVPVRLPWGDLWILKSDALSQAIQSNEGFEPAERLFINQYLKPGMNVLDVGAHRGFFTLLFSHKVGSEGNVYSFEPSPREYTSLLKHLKINHKGNVKVEQLAIGDSIGQTELYVCRGLETGCNSLRPPEVDEKTSAVTVTLTTLDMYLAKTDIPKIDFVKIDVEGGEIGVLKGAVGLCGQKPRPVFLCEISDLRTKPWGYNANEIYDFLSAYDFHWFSISDSGTLVKSARKVKFHENLVAVPSEKLSMMKNLIV